MQLRDPKVLVPSIGASVAFAAALDAYFRVGAVDWVIDLCFSDPEATAASGMMKDMPEVPMKHTGHALLYASIGSALASTACVAGLWQARQEAPLDPTLPSAEGQYALIAALSILANTSFGARSRHVMEVYAEITDDTLSDEGAAIAFDYFTPDAMEDAPEIFGSLERPIDRELVICGSIRAARTWPNPAPLIDTVVAIADSMDMTAQEINEIWDAYISGEPETEEMPEPAPAKSAMRLWFDELSTSLAQPARLFSPVAPSTRAPSN